MEYAYDEEVELGRGGMAVVYEATHPDRPGTLALKRPLPFPHAPYTLRGTCTVTPNNVLGFPDQERGSGVRWVIADCGLARRPLGETTEGLTGSVSRLGTDGYMAPESFGDPHSVTESADVYSLGRILAFLLTGRRPTVTTPLLPDDGPWRPVVRRFTRPDPAERPRTADEALDLGSGDVDGPSDLGQGHLPSADR